MKIYTKTGDEGKTSLLNGKRVPKYDLRIELLGLIDELTSNIGLAKSELSDKNLKEELHSIQEKLKILMAHIADGSEETYKLTIEDVEYLEKTIDGYSELYVKKNEFIIPGDNKKSALLDVARVIARKAERYLISIERFYSINENSKIYLNRLSDTLYTFARYTDYVESSKGSTKTSTKVMSVLNDKKEVTMEVTKSMNLELSKLIIGEIEQMAAVNKIPVVVAVANEWGIITAVHFMDGALPASFDLAINKAYTSATIRIPTEELKDLAQSGGELFGINITNPKLVAFPGGFPLKLNGKVIGAVGVSGSTATLDNELAAYGVKVFEEVVKWL